MAESMLRSNVSRFRLSVGALGCAVLGACLFNLVQSLHARDEFTWVPVNASKVPAIETAEIWQVSGSCVRPYFARALLRSEARLKAYYAFAPAAVRARLHSVSLPQSSTQTRWYHLVTRVPEGPQSDAPDPEYVAQLHVQYAEWYANVFKLEIEKSQWQRRYANVADQRLMLSESARKSFAAYSPGGGKLAGAKGDFDDYVLSTLGLGGFPSYEQEVLRADCVKISLVKKIAQDTGSFKEFWHWPVEQAVGVAFGLELILIGIFLVPITLWIGTGDLQIAARHVRSEASRLAANARAWIALVSRATARSVHDGASRLAAEIRNFDSDKFVAGVLERLRTTCMGIRDFLRSLARALIEWMPPPAGGWPVHVSAAATGERTRRERLVSLGSLAAELFAELRSGKDGRRATWTRRPSPKSRPRW
jgi:hypothetical protein